MLGNLTQISHRNYFREVTPSAGTLYLSPLLLFKPTKQINMSKLPEKLPAEEDASWTYHQPTKGILSLLPPSWVPYAELTRIHKPVGNVVIYLPYLLGALFGAIIQPTPTSPSTMISAASNLLAASVILRSAGCTWNDVVDYKFDQQVARCRLRPVARGAVSPRSGTVFFVVQMGLWLASLWFICPRSLYAAAPVVPLVLAYPYAKRVTDYPQLVLGITLAWGIFPGSVVTGIDIARMWKDNAPAAMGLWSLFVAYVTWTLVYDTIYAFQDIQDDVTSGVRSMAISWRHSAKTLLALLAAVQIFALSATGWSVDAGLGYYVGSCGGSAVALGVMIWRVDLQEPKACAWWFQYGILMVGACMTAGMVANWVARFVFFEW